MIDKPVAEQIWQILVEECGVRGQPCQRNDFLHYVTHPSRFGHEFRFQGALGFGGKFYAERARDDWRVGCYREDRTQERDAMIFAANARLQALRERSR